MSEHEPSVFQQLYDSEINFAVSCLWDGGFQVKLGDPSNGFKAVANLDSWEEVEPWLRSSALHHFPESAFAKDSVAF
ncbi:MAG TPA: hypothetical protein VMZ30_03645 [Pyrinomonadaceae bacterium]|nr:hypothetical protein [Pyrinomonadaceae bacterium]